MKRAEELAVAFAFFAMTLFFLFRLFTGPLSEGAYFQARGERNPVQFPLFMLGLLLVLSAVNFLYTLMKVSKGEGHEEGAETHIEESKKTLLAKAVATYVIFCLFVAFFNVLGYYISAFLFLLSTFFLFGLRSFFRLILFSFAISAGIGIIFSRVLHLVLPVGILGAL